MKMRKKIIYGIWLGIVFFLLILFLVSPSSFSPEKIVTTLNNYQSHLLIAYTVVSVFRGLILIPSTPFVLAGVLLFPDQPWAVMVISMIGVIAGSSAIYFFSDFLGFSNKLENKYPKKISLWHKRLNSPRASFFVVGWSFFPFVPTDLLCYVAGIVKMPFRYLITGVIIGEAIIISLYVFYGTGVVEYLSNSF